MSPRLQKTLLACGLLYSLGYAIVNDVVAATMYAGYSRMSQAVSELSGTGSPVKAFLTASLPVFSVLMVGFGIGVWQSAYGRKSLRMTGIVLIAHGIFAPLWLFYPMTSRQEMIAGTMPANDAGHLVLTAVTIILILSQLGSGAMAFGKRFRFYSIVSAVMVLLFGALTGVESAKIPAGDSTPLLGLFERVGIGAWLLWMAVLAIMLLRASPKSHPSDVSH